MIEEAKRLMDAGRYAEAERLYQELSDKGGPNPEAGMALARIAMRQGHWEQAVARWDEFLKSSHAVDAVFERGHALLELDRLDEAEAVFIGLCKAHAQLPHGWLGMGRIAMRQGEWPLALTRWDAVLRTFPERLDAVFEKAQSLMEMKRLDDAEALYQKVLGSVYGHWSFLHLIKIYQLKGERQRAGEFARQYAGIKVKARQPAGGKRRVLVFGSSHVAAIKDGLAGFVDDCVEVVIRLQPQKLLLDAAGAFDADYRAMLEDAQDFDACIMSVGGNEHTMFGIARHPVDYYFGTSPSGPDDIRACYIPYRLFREAFMKRFAFSEGYLRFFAAVLPRPLIVLESPPPPANDEYIAASIDPVLREGIERYGVAPKRLRRELWRLRSDHVKRLCAQMECDFLEAPQEAMDESGYLVESACGNATHGNAAYGRMVLDQIACLARDGRI
jgi:tetratricopeptide (TPR) repeat protein